MKFQFIIKSLFVLLLFITVFTNCDRSESKQASETPANNTLTKTEKDDGWQLLFDGQTFDGWRGLGREKVPEGLWKIEDGTIRKINSGLVPSLPDGRPVEGGDLTTIQTFENYELYFEWKILKAGNSGLKYNVSEELSKRYGSGYSALGFEYQLLDDGDSIYRELKPSQYTGSLYDMIPAKNVTLKPVGEFNSSRIIIDGNHVEHWLNGKKVVEFEFGSHELDSLFRKSKYHQYEGFIEKKKAHIVLQNHKDDAWFRNIKIRETQ